MAKTRDDIKGEPRCPKYIEEFLRRVGGKNPLNESIYRCVHTTTRYKIEGGAWNLWDENLTLQERGGLILSEQGLLIPSPHKPNRVEVGLREMLKYSGFVGWVVERWMPASFYGTRDAWPHLQGHADIPLLGPYPIDGDYEACSTISAELPSLGDLHNAILTQVAWNESRLQEDVTSIVKQRAYEAEWEFEEQMRKEREENEYRIRDFLSPWKSLSLEASRWRNDAARKAGVKEHA